MNKIIKSGAVIAAAVALSLTGATGSFAADAATPGVNKVALTPEQKAAFEAARSAATTPEAKKAARDAFKAAMAAAKAGIPAKPVKPVRP